MDIFSFWSHLRISLLSLREKCIWLGLLPLCLSPSLKDSGNESKHFYVSIWRSQCSIIGAQMEWEILWISALLVPKTISLKRWQTHLLGSLCKKVDGAESSVKLGPNSQTSMPLYSVYIHGTVGTKMNEWVDGWVKRWSIGFSQNIGLGLSVQRITLNPVGNVINTITLIDPRPSFSNRYLEQNCMQFWSTLVQRNESIWRWMFVPRRSNGWFHESEMLEVSNFLWVSQLSIGLKFHLSGLWPFERQEMSFEPT